MRPIVVAALVVAALGPYPAHLTACGDKSLSAGSIRMQRAQKYHASILIYTQPHSPLSAATQELKLQETLRLFGHSYREVSSPSELDAALASGSFNIVMTDVAVVPDVLKHLDPVRPRPAIVGLAYKLSKTEAKNAAKTQRFVLKLPGRTSQFLDTIAEAARSSEAAPRKL